MVIRVVRDSSLPSEKRPFSSRGRGGSSTNEQTHFLSRWYAIARFATTRRRGGGSVVAVLVQPGVAWQIAEEGSARRVGGSTLYSNDGST